MIEKQGIINFKRYYSKSYASVFLNHFGFAFLGEEKDATLLFSPLLCFICIIREVYRQIFLSSKLQKVFRRVPQIFFF